MKHRIPGIIISSILILFSIGAFSQSVDDIINKHIEAHGGLSKWNQVKALKITGNFTSFSIENEYVGIKTNGGDYFANFHIGEEAVTESFFEGDGWTIDPWQEIPYARGINGDEKDVFSRKAMFFTPFYQYKEKGHVVNYLGKDTIDGIELFVLELTRSNQKKEKWYLDTQTYLEYYCTSEWVDFAQKAPSESFFDDFREVDGLIIPFFVERTFWQRDRILQIENVEINPEFDPLIFKKPARIEMEKLGFLIGNWNVQAEIITRRGNWYDLGSHKSKINFAETNLLEENFNYENSFPISKILHFSFNQKNNNYKLIVYNSLSTEVDIFEGTDTSGKYIFENGQFSSIEKKDQQFLTRYVYTITDMDHFVLEIEMSGDAGTTWNPNEKFTYSR